MVAELDMADQDVTKIADMIDGEIASLMPGWKRGFKLDESPHYSDNKYCLNCCSKGSFMDYRFPNNPSGKSLQALQCSERGCAAVDGRFEEISYQFEGSEQCVTEGAPAASSQSDGLCYTDIWAQHGGPELSSQGSTVQPLHCEDEEFRESTSGKVDKIINVDKESSSEVRHSHYENTSSTHDVADDYENEIRQEMRWLKAKYQMQLRQLKDQQLRFMSQSTSSLDADDKEQKKDQLPYTPNPLIEEKDKHRSKSVASEKQFNSYFPVDAEKECANKRIQNYEAAYGSCSPVHMVTAKSYYVDSLLQHTLHRATSLPVDAVDF